MSQNANRSVMSFTGVRCIIFAIVQTANQKVLYVLSFEGLLLLTIYLEYCKPELSIYFVLII